MVSAELQASGLTAQEFPALTAAILAQSPSLGEISGRLPALSTSLDVFGGTTIIHLDPLSPMNHLEAGLQSTPLSSLPGGGHLDTDLLPNPLELVGAVDHLEEI
jgi:hypothetical protein